MSKPRATSLNISSSRRGLIPGRSEQFKRYKILRRQQNRASSLHRNARDHVNDEDSSNSDHSLDLDPDMEMQKVVNLCRVYTNDLYLPLRDQHQTNLVYSPLGYCLSTVMLHKGCIGPCKKELSQAIFSPTANSRGNKSVAKDGGDHGDTESEGTCSEIATGLTALLNSITKCGDDSYIFKHAYKLYLDKDHKPRSSYISHVKTIHPGRVELEDMDFTGEEWSKCTHKINQWAHSAGGSMLGEMVTKKSADPKIIFLNPMYFMGNWMHPFNPALTHEMKFFVNDKDFVSVPMMKSGVLKNLLYTPINKLACKALVLPYKGDRLSLIIFLPNDRIGLSTIEASMDSISPSDYFQDMYNLRKKLSTHSGFQVYLPNFKIDCTLDLQGPMKELGVDSLFQSGKADFSGLARNAPKDLCVTQIIQKVVIHVNEIGSAELPKRFRDTNIITPFSSEKTRDAHPTDSDGGVDGFNVIEFQVDHPFYFQLVDVKSDLIVLAGMCKNPLHGKDLGFKEFLDKYDIEMVPKPKQLNVGRRN